MGSAFFPLSLAHIYTGNSTPTAHKLHSGDQGIMSIDGSLCCPYNEAAVHSFGQRSEKGKDRGSRFIPELPTTHPNEMTT